MGAVFSSHQEYERLSADAKIGIEHKVVEGKNYDEESEYDPSLATSNSANNQETSCLVDILNTPTTSGVLCRFDLDSIIGDMLLTPNLNQQTHQHVIEVSEDEAMQHLEGAHMITSKLLIAFILGFTLMLLLVALLFHKELGVES